MTLRNVLRLGAGVALVGLLLAGCAGAPAVKRAPGTVNGADMVGEVIGGGVVNKTEGDVVVNFLGLGYDQCRSLDEFLVFGPLP